MIKHQTVLFVSALFLWVGTALAEPALVGKSYLNLPTNKKTQLQAARGLLGRLLPSYIDQFKMEILPSEKGHDVFEIESKEGKIVLRGSSGVALASALNFYLKNSCNCHLSYCGNQMNLPTKLPPVKEKIRIINLYKYRVYYNYCTLSYTAPWWDWKRWEQEIDFMALNGVNTPLSVIGLEGVWYNTLLKFGYSDEEARKFLVGPAFFAWQWMTNIQSHGGPLPKSWIISHIKLGQQILQRQRALGMTPIQQGFSGSMPMDFKSRFPDIDIAPGQHWCAFQSVPSQLNPLDPMFIKFGTAFLEEEIRLFGTSHLYAADPFHEGRPPENSEPYLTKVGKTINQLLVSVDPDAKCAMQSWSIRKPIACAFPKQRLLILDLSGHKDAETENFWGYDYVKGQLHNFGGRINLHGDLKDIAQNRFATASKSITNCVGMGLFMEGMVQNPVFYDLVFDQFWSDRPCDPQEWLKKYARRRYGAYSENAEKAWEILLETAYKRGTSGVENSSIVCARPALICKKSGPNAGFVIPYPPTKLLEALDLLLKDRDLLSSSDAYRYDIVDLTRQVLSNLGQMLQKDASLAFVQKDKKAFKQSVARFLDLLQDMDSLLSTRPEFSFGKWLSDARRWGTNPSEKALFEKNASMLVTTWGPEEKPIIFDYSWREWSGLISAYYLPRWEEFYAYLSKQMEKGVAYTDPTKLCFGREALEANSFYTTLAKWEVEWPCKHHEIPTKRRGKEVNAVLSILKKYRPLITYEYSDQHAKKLDQWEKYIEQIDQKNRLEKNGMVIGTWNPEKLSDGSALFDLDNKIEGEGLYEVRIFPQGKKDLKIQKVVLLQDGVPALSASLKKGKQKNIFRFKINEIAFGAAYHLQIKKGSNTPNIKATVYLKKIP